MPFFQPIFTQHLPMLGAVLSLKLQQAQLLLHNIPYIPPFLGLCLHFLWLYMHFLYVLLFLLVPSTVLPTVAV